MTVEDSTRKPGQADGASAPLRVLMVEDSPVDAELVERALRTMARPLEIRRVETEADFRRQLATFAPQLILSDFALPHFDGLSAVALASQLAPDVPVLFVSGTIGEELAIEVLHRGAADYVLKDNLARLPAAAQRVLEAAAEQARRREAERALRLSEERFRTVAETTEDWIWEIDLEGRLIYVNANLEHVLGRSCVEAIGQYGIGWMHLEDRALVEAALPALVAECRGWRHWTLRWLHADGSLRWLESNATPTFDEQGALTGFRGADRDVTDRVEREARLEFLAYHNPVTGLPNRTALRELLAARMERGPLLVGMLRVSRFHEFTSARGREFAEDLLCAVGTRLRALLEEGALIAHFGDQVFTFAIGAGVGPGADEAGMDEAGMDETGMDEAGMDETGMDETGMDETGMDETGMDETRALAFAHRIERELREQPLAVGSEMVHINVRIGVAISPLHGAEPLLLERNAESALSETIRRKDSVGVFDQRSRARAEEWNSLERDLRGAIERDEFELHFQPKFRVQGHQLCGAEALLRWRHPQRGMVSPADFIPVVEQTGMIIELGDWVRRSAMVHAVGWRERGMAGLRIAVNVSARELQQPDFVERCVRTLMPQAADQCLDLELTESLIMDDIHRSIAAFETLRGCGTRIAIDDFGTGYSSLNYLTRLPVDTLKIDRSFIAQLAQSADAVSMVSNVIQLAHSLGLKVVAEGVEDEEQAKLLRLLRCDEMQGYLLGRPLPAAEFEKLLFD